MRRCKGHREQRVRSQVALGIRSIQLDHLRVESRLIARIAADERRLEHRVDVVNGLQDALAPIALLVAIPQFHRFPRAGRCAGWHRGAAQAAGVK